MCVWVCMCGCLCVRDKNKAGAIMPVTGRYPVKEVVSKGHLPIQVTPFAPQVNITFYTLSVGVTVYNTSFINPS